MKFRKKNICYQKVENFSLEFLENMLAFFSLIGYNMYITKPPEVFDHPVFLNLHHFKRNSNIFESMSGLPKQSVEDRSSFEGIHLAIARSQKTGTGTLGNIFIAACSSVRAAGPREGASRFSFYGYPWIDMLIMIRQTASAGIYIFQ